jgi:hypothetical protein
LEEDFGFSKRICLNLAYSSRIMAEILPSHQNIKIVIRNR